MKQFLIRLIRSRRVRAFVLVSFFLHLLLAGWLMFSTSTREWIFGSKNPLPAPMEDAAPYEIQQAIITLTNMHEARLRATAQQLYQIRDRLNQLQLAKTARMQVEDQRRQTLMTAEAATRPSRAQFVARIDIVPPPFELPLPPDLAALRLVELYNLHCQLEQRTGRIYERYRALQLAESIVDPLPLSKSLGVSNLVLPPRRAVDLRALDPQITTLLDGRFAAMKREMNEISLESEHMVTTARGWLTLAERIELEQSTLIGENILRIPPPAVPYYGHIINKRLLRATNLTRVINPPVSLGNQITDAAGIPAEWMSLDRWWTIGPFLHPGAQRRLDDLDRKYPPESIIDLDATYEGKGGAKLRWKYRRMGDQFLEGGVRVEPFIKDNGPYAIWYFYAEMASTVNQEVLASFASDDYGVCWVNGQRVYQSPPDTTPWVPFNKDSFRKISLKKGLNKFLFKLENATGTTGFSVVLQINPESTVPPGPQQE